MIISFCLEFSFTIPGYLKLKRVAGLGTAEAILDNSAKVVSIGNNLVIKAQGMGSDISQLHYDTGGDWSLCTKRNVNNV